MNLHEYQAKQLFAQYGMPVPQGAIAGSVEEAEAAARQLGAERFVVKAQVHAGGRGKAGGVVLVDGIQGVKDAAARLLGTRLVTYQTDAQGQPIHHVLIEVCSDIERELYLGIVLDRSQQRIVVMASQEGGVDIETVAHESPEKICKVTIDPLVKVQPYQARALARALALNPAQSKAFAGILHNLCRLYHEKDLAMVEINPLIVRNDGALVCLDGKINLDENALYRHADLQAMRDTSQEDPRELLARNFELNYVALDGNIGCMVNGAGLAMATMDIIQLHGGTPANFLDVGGGATQERVTQAFKIILSDPSVKAVLVNIFGGIVRCDLIADGIIAAVKEVGIHIPVVVRLEGNNAEKARAILDDSGLNIISAQGLTEAAQRVVEAAQA